LLLRDPQGSCLRLDYLWSSGILLSISKNVAL
jgi:hypothetical protein